MTNWEARPPHFQAPVVPGLSSLLARGSCLAVPQGRHEIGEKQADITHPAIPATSTLLRLRGAISGGDRNCNAGHQPLEIVPDATKCSNHRNRSDLKPPA